MSFLIHALLYVTGMEKELLKPNEVDLLFRYPLGRTKKLAKQGKIPSVILPDGEIRFLKSDIDSLMNQSRAKGENNV